uniref:Uncharacterized protein n=1 Tax=Glossina brevipalpis TaxID=37001 RepID=A0A1A9X3M4_9MUSC
MHLQMATLQTSAACNVLNGFCARLLKRYRNRTKPHMNFNYIVQAIICGILASNSLIHSLTLVFSIISLSSVYIYNFRAAIAARPYPNLLLDLKSTDDNDRLLYVLDLLYYFCLPLMRNVTLRALN